MLTITTYTYHEPLYSTSTSFSYNPPPSGTMNPLPTGGGTTNPSPPPPPPAGSYLSGTAGADLLVGGDGDDLIFGNAGADTLRGMGGKDFLDGGNGADTLIGGNGNDTLRGGAGLDTFVFNSGDGSDRILDFQDGDKIDLRSMANIDDLSDISLTNNTATSCTISSGDVTISVTNTSGIPWQPPRDYAGASSLRLSARKLAGLQRRYCSQRPSSTVWIGSGSRRADP